MNKWMKTGLSGLIVSTISVSANASALTPSKEEVMARAMVDSVLVDASDLIASKLKDRMIQLNAAEMAEIDQVLIDASDLIASKLKDRMINLEY